MLQQTRVSVVREYYTRFMQRFPTIADLAHAKESTVLAFWSGLGYYRRARSLHAAAKLVTKRHGGRLPQSASGLMELPGIGRYTASAIASIAFDEPAAVVDGNVERVIGRIVGKNIRGEDLWRGAQQLLDHRRPGDFNQAMMELGAIICLPGVPVCDRCPVESLCTSAGKDREQSTPTLVRLRRSTSLVFVECGGAILLQRRSENDRQMPGMWELPPADESAHGKLVLRVNHSITNTDWSVRVYTATRMPANSNERFVKTSQLSRYPLTGVTRKILRALDFL
jgi:A/G-specific adenine glycosylase